MYLPGVHEIKLHGAPWFASGEETMRARDLLLTLMETLEEEGWTVYASIDQDHDGSGNGETDTVSLHVRLNGLKLTVENSGMYVGSKAGLRARPCTIARLTVENYIRIAHTMEK
jgi:hypothetical protein